MREALEASVTTCDNNAAAPISKKEAEMLLGKLRKELGINGTAATSTPQAPSPGASLSNATLRDVLYNSRKQDNRPGSGESTVVKHDHKPQGNVSCHDAVSEQELCDLLHDASLDDSTVQEAMRNERDVYSDLFCFSIAIHEGSYFQQAFTLRRGR